MLVTFGFPIVSMLIFVVLSSLNQDTVDMIAPLAGLVDPQASESAKIRPDGYVDESGLISLVPTGVSDAELLAFDDEISALGALDNGDIQGYYLIAEDYLQTGTVTYVGSDFNPFSASAGTGILDWVLTVNLLDGDTTLANRVSNLFDLQVTVLEPLSDRDQDNPLSFFLPYGVTFMYYMIILMSASLLLNSVTKEKENRMVEIMMSTTTPRQLLTGKFVGLGLIGVLQAVLWVGTGFILLRLSGSTFQLPEEYLLPASVLIWGLIFFLLGYAVYASLMAGVGALVPNLREASQVTLIVIAPLLLPLMMISVLVREPNGTLAVILSLFPLSAPVSMMTRLAAAEVPLWQILLSITLLAVTALLIMRTVAKMFRAQTLLSGQSFSIKGVIDAFRSHG